MHHHLIFLFFYFSLVFILIFLEVLFIQFIDPTLGLLNLIANDSNSEESLFGAAVGLIRDLTDTYGAKIGDKLKAHSACIQQIVNQARMSSSSRAKENAAAVIKALSKL